MKFNLYFAQEPRDRSKKWGEIGKLIPHPETVEIENLDDLKNLQKQWGNHSLVIDLLDDPGITVYNDYLE